MASTMLFVILIIIVLALLLTISITSAIAAADIASSSAYNIDQKARDAHQQLTIAASLGWSALAILIAILIMAAVTGGFTKDEISNELLNSKTPSKKDLLAVYKNEKELSKGQSISLIVLIVLFIIAIITFVIGILNAIAATNISPIQNVDNKTHTAYTESIIGAVVGIAGVVIIGISIWIYMVLRNNRKKQISQLRNYEEVTESKLSVTKQQLETSIKSNTPLPNSNPPDITISGDGNKTTITAGGNKTTISTSGDGASTVTTSATTSAIPTTSKSIH